MDNMGSLFVFLFRYDIVGHDMTGYFLMNNQQVWKKNELGATNFFGDF